MEEQKPVLGKKTSSWSKRRKLKASALKSASIEKIDESELDDFFTHKHEEQFEKLNPSSSEIDTPSISQSSPGGSVVGSVAVGVVEIGGEPGGDEDGDGIEGGEREGGEREEEGEEKGEEKGEVEEEEEEVGEGEIVILDESPIEVLDSSPKEDPPDQGEVTLHDEELQRVMKERDLRLAAEKLQPEYMVRITIYSRQPLLSKNSVHILLGSKHRFRDVIDLYLNALEENNVEIDSEAYELASSCFFLWNGLPLPLSSTPFRVGIDRSNPFMVLRALTEEEDANRDKEDDFDESQLVNQEEVQQQEDDEYFKISLRGSDNIPVDVSVCSTTQISKLIDYFKQQKNLGPSVNVVLEFDTEPLPPGGVVGDTELEADYTIDVLY